MVQLQEDVLEELERDVLGLRDPLALDRALTRGGELQHSAEGVVGLGGNAHGRILAAHG
jgi:hypothetical protein